MSDDVIEQAARVLAMSYGAHLDPPRGNQDWRAAEDLASQGLLAAHDEQVRADERERIARAIEAELGAGNTLRDQALTRAARIARQGGAS